VGELCGRAATDVSAACTWSAWQISRSCKLELWVRYSAIKLQLPAWAVTGQAPAGEVHAGLGLSLG
jgi:hypothetical protein